jgi:glycosyltransferase involved in cell wall biosynthesis
LAFSIILPSRNESNLRACVGAIRAAGETCRVIVVWDGSPYDGPPFDDEMLIKETDVRFGEIPFSWPRNVNIGILAAGDDDVVIMGDDALLKTPMGLSRMRSAMATRPHLGVLSAGCNGVGNANQRPNGGRLGWQPSAVVRPEPRMLCFITVMVPRAVINVVGFLDQRFNSYACADDDYTLGVFDGCFVDHESLPSTFRAPGIDSSLEHGKRMFLEKWGVSNDET